MDEFIYEIGSSEKVKIFDAELKSDLAELKAELEDNEITHGVSRVVSSVAVPKDIVHFARERALAIKKGLKVCEAMPVQAQADQMTKELQLSLVSDYSTESLPLLLHQYFLDRIHQLIHCKYMHLIRWRRFQAHTKTIEALYPDYKQRLDLIMSEYADCIQRAQRLSVAHETLLAMDNHRALMSLKPDDVLIYLCWLVSHLASVRKFHQYLRVLEWLPVVHRFDVLPLSSHGAVQSDEPVQSPRNKSNSNVDFSMPYSRESQRLQSPAIRPSFSTSVSSKTTLQTTSLAAAGGGLASDENTLGLPVNSSEVSGFEGQLNQLLLLYGVETKQPMTLSSDEMELYSAVLRKFRTVFVRQEHLRTFKTYDLTEPGQKTWGSDFSMHALKKDSNWISFSTMKAEIDPYQEKQLVDLRKQKNIDLLLQAQFHFIQLANAEKVQEALKEHALAVREPPGVAPISIDGRVTHRVEGTAVLWQKIYTNPELYRTSEALGKEMMKAGGSDSQGQAPKVKNSRPKQKNGLDSFNAVQILKLDDGDQENKDPSSLQGAYLSFLFLRHLRIRDLQRTCLSFLNYFRSIERTLTINDSGLTCDENHFYKKTSPQNHQRLTINTGIGSHQHLHNTPADFRMSETEFMQFSELDNHDDFYSIDEGRVHVQDQRGLYVVYDAAIEDLRNLETDLLLVATYYLEKDRNRRFPSTLKQPDIGLQRESSAGDFQIGGYGHQEIDRFGILLDLWTNEAAFLDAKKELLDCFMEAYCHVSDRDEKRRLAQCIVNVMYRRPRFDFQSEYFVKSYRLECVCLQTEMKLVKAILDNQIEEQRDYTGRICRGDPRWGMPHDVIRKQPISVNSSRSVLADIYLLEFHPSLAIASQIPLALKRAFWELYSFHKPATVAEMVMLEKKMLECALSDWQQMPLMGSSFSQQVQKELFTGAIIEDPLFVFEAAQTLATQAEQQAMKKSLHDRQLIVLGCLGNMLELVTLRSRLIDAAWQSEILAKIYKKQMVEFGAEDCHLYMRFVQFEFAQAKDTPAAAPSVFITAVKDDARLDRFTPNFLYLAIHELDESHVGKFSFQNLEAILQMLRDKSIESLQAILAAQIVHKNSLLCAVQLAEVCLQVKETTAGQELVSQEDTKGEKSSVSLAVGPSVSPVVTSSVPSQSSDFRSRPALAFVSIQLEKVLCRDAMLNQFVIKNSQLPNAQKNPAEMEKLKRKLILQFCSDLNGRIAQHSLRAQIISRYNGILKLIEDFPAVKDKYFMIGEPNERKSLNDETVLEPDPRSFKRRPRFVMSDDGKSLLNLWFLPHPFEVLGMFRQLSDQDCRQALGHLLTIVSSLHDILQYLFAYARLGSAWRFHSVSGSGLSAEWGGVDAIGSALKEVQRQMDSLSRRTDPELVGRMLSLRRGVMFLQFDLVVRHTLHDHFLSTGNIPAFKALVKGMHFGLHNLSNCCKSTVMSTYFNVPEPLEAGDAQALKLYPWRNFINSNGPYAVQFWQWELIEYHMQMCLCGLSDINQKVANAELVSISLLMEDVLTAGYQDMSSFGSLDQNSELALGRRGSHGAGKLGRSLSQLQEPIESYALMRSFLILWKRLEKFKSNWVTTRLGVEEINNTALYKASCREYKKEVLIPTMQNLAKDHNQPEIYDAIISDDDLVVLSKGVSEMESKTRQLVKLLERFEGHLILEVKKRIQKELTLTLAERAREENALPTDLWKRPSIREAFTITRPQIIENFVTNLFQGAKVEDGIIVMSEDHLTTCLNEVSQTVMAREKFTYENYSTFYENLLRANHQLLYQKEQEVKHLRDQLRSLQSTLSVEVQCQLAETSLDLLLEVIALRAKVNEMRELNQSLEQDVRERIREEYNGLVQNLVASIFDLKTKFDKFRKELYDDVLEKISEMRTEAVEAVGRLALRAGVNTDAEAMRRSLSTTRQLRDLQEDNHDLSIMLLKLRAISKLRLHHERGIHARQQSNLVKMVEMRAKEKIKQQMAYEKEKQLLQEQLAALRSALKISQVENDSIRKDLEKEMKERTDKSHSTQQQALSLKQLEEARLAKIKKLCVELEENRGRMQVMSEEQEKNRRLQLLHEEKVKKDADAVRKQLQLERSLKLSAFQRLEDLYAEMSDREERENKPVTIRPHTAITSGTRSSRPNSTVAKSLKRSNRATSAPYRQALPWSNPRSSSVISDSQDLVPNNAAEYKKLQRPKTSNSRFRTALANQLLNELEPPSHREFTRLRSAAATERSQDASSSAGLRSTTAN